MKPIVLLHGWGTVPQVWQALIDALPNQAFINLALPGYNNEGSWQAPAAYIAEQLPQQCHLVGWSLGGNLAMDIAERYPQRIASVSTVASTPSFVATKVWPHAMQSAVFNTFLDSMRAQPAITLKRFVGLQAKGADHERDINKAMRSLAASASNEVLVDSLDWLGNNQQGELWQNLGVARQHIFCGGDALVPVSAAEHCLYSVVLDDAGHAPMLSKPDELAALLNKFWAGLE